MHVMTWRALSISPWMMEGMNQCYKDDGNGYFMYNLDQGAAGTDAPYPTQVRTDTPHTPLIRS